MTQLEKFRQVKTLISEGLSTREACEKAGISKSSFYSLNQKARKDVPVMKPVKIKNPTEPTIEKYQQAKKLIESGMTVSNAVHQVGLGWNAYYSLRKKDADRVNKNTPPIKRERKKPALIQIESALIPTDFVLIVAGKGDAVKEALGLITQMKQ